MAPQTPTVRVVVRLPYARPEQPLDNPPPVSGSNKSLECWFNNLSFQIEWNLEKANILWEVIARSRSSDSGGTDCTHLLTLR